MSDQQFQHKPKRPRPVLSCLECRRKKLKCDRLLPCQQCLKLGQPSLCRYAIGQEPELRGEASITESLTKRARVNNSTESLQGNAPQLDELHDRVRRLEEALRSQQSACSSPYVHDGETPFPNTEQSQATPALEESIFVVSILQGEDGGFSMCKKFQDVTRFTRSLKQRSHDTAIQSAAARLFTIQRAVSNPFVARSASVAAYTDLPSLMHHMVQLLPVTRTRNKLIELYFENFEHTVHVTHKPDFRFQLQRYDQGLLDSKQVEYFIPLLIGVLSIACNLNTYPECDLAAFNGRQNGNGAVQLLNNWYDVVARRDGITTTAVQVKLLTMQSQKHQGTDYAELWVTSAQLVRQAMMLNMHNETTGLTPYEEEMNRCLWLAILEQDLALAIACEMPPMCPSYNLKPPVNCDDGEFTEGVTSTPAGYSTQKWTDGLCGHILATTFNQRLEAYKHRFAPLSVSHYEKTVDHAKSLEVILRGLPPSFRLDYLSDQAANTPGRLMAQMEVDIALRRPLIATCAPYARAVCIDEDFREARLPWVQSHLVVICFQDLFDPQYPALDVPRPTGYWDFFYNAYRYDSVQSLEAMLIEANHLKQIDIITKNNNDGTNGASNSRLPTKPMRWNFAAMMKSVEDTLNPMKRRIGSYGEDLRSIAKYNMLYDCLRTPAGEDSDGYMLEGLQTLASDLSARLEKEGHILQSAREELSTTDVDIEWLADFLSLEDAGRLNRGGLRNP